MYPSNTLLKKGELHPSKEGNVPLKHTLLKRVNCTLQEGETLKGEIHLSSALEWNGTIWPRSKVIQSDMGMGNWNVKLLLDSKVKGRTLQRPYTCTVQFRRASRASHQSSLLHSYSMRVKAARNLLLRAVESLDDRTTRQRRTTALHLRVRFLSHVVHPPGLHLQVRLALPS